MSKPFKKDEKHWQIKRFYGAVQPEQEFPALTDQKKKSIQSTR